MAVLSIDPTTVTNPPTGMTPEDSAAIRDIVVAGGFAGDGESYADKAAAVKVARAWVKAVSWVSRGEVRSTARYATNPDGTITFYVKARPADEAEDAEAEAEAEAEDAESEGKSSK